MKIEAIDIFGATALAALAGVAIAGAVKRKREQDKIKSIISGIGYTTPTLGRKRMQTYFMSDRDIRPASVEVDLSYTRKQGEYAYVIFHNVYKPATYWWVRKDDLRYLSELCDNWDIEFSAWNGEVWIPSLHKEIAYDFVKDEIRLPKI